MSKERRFNVRPQLDCFYFPSEDVDHLDSKKKSNLESKTQENGNISVIKMLDALRFASSESKVSSVLKNIPSRTLKDVEYLLETSNRSDKDQLRRDNLRSIQKDDFKMLGLSPRSSIEVDTNDSLSDSAYSQSSDFSRDADVASFNTTTSSGSNDLFVYQQIMQSDRTETGCETVTMYTANGFCIDIDVEVTKTVVMLMKIILWLRQREAKRITFAPRQLNFPLENHSRIEKSLTNETKQPKSPKRISFSPCTLLISAVSEKAFFEAKKILESDEDIDINTKTPSGQSLIHIAAANADLKCVQLLLDHGANPNIKDAFGWGPLHNAIRRGRWKCAILLIEAGADFGEYSNQRINEYQEVLRMSRTCYKSMEIFV